MKLLQSLKKQWFLLGMLFAMILAALIPQWGASQGVLQLQHLTKWGVALVFFLHGLNLATREILKGLSHYRLHLFIQCCTFLAYPLVWLLCGKTLLSFLPEALAWGFCYLMVLPSTISSSVAMTAIAKGNVPGAIVNASLSGLLGMVFTPLLIQGFMGIEGLPIDISQSIKGIAILLLLPMILGQMARPWLLAHAKRYPKLVNNIDKWVILLIVFNAFSDSVNDQLWQNFGLNTMLLTLGLATLLLVVMVALIRFTSRLCGFSREDAIAAIFCGSKKTLAAGAPMAKILFAGNPMLGFILLPIMIYHPLQIFYCAALAERYAKQVNEPV